MIFYALSIVSLIISVMVFMWVIWQTWELKRLAEENESLKRKLNDKK